MAGMTIDMSEVRTLEADMRAIDGRLGRHVVKVVEKGAVNIKADLREKMNASEHFWKIARHITYDMEYENDSIVAEIGPVKRGQGKVAHIAYFGGSGWSERKKPGKGWQQGPGGGGTVEDPSGAMDREAPKFEQSLADLAAELVFSR